MIETKSVRLENKCAVAIVKTGRKYYQCVVIDFPIKVVKIKITDAQYLLDIDYPVKKAARKIKNLVKVHKITESAKQILKEALI